MTIICTTYVKVRLYGPITIGGPNRIEGAAGPDGLGNLNGELDHNNPDDVAENISGIADLQLLGEVRKVLVISLEDIMAIRPEYDDILLFIDWK